MHATTEQLEEEGNELTVRVLVTFDFEEWEGQYRIYEADLTSQTKRIVDLLKEREVSATFFLDAETTLKYPRAAELLADPRFELALHSDYHFSVNNPRSAKFDFSLQSSEMQMSRMQGATSLIRDVIPTFSPKGFRAPGLRWNEDLYVSLRKLGFFYDSSQQDRFAFHPFLKQGVVVIPVNSGEWDSACYRTRPQYVITSWRDRFRKACQEAAQTGTSYFMLLVHPSVSGKHKYIGMLKDILNYMSWSKPEYRTCREFAAEYLARSTEVYPDRDNKLNDPHQH